jgi:hypothetical protein
VGSQLVTKERGGAGAARDVLEGGGEGVGRLLEHLRRSRVHGLHRLHEALEGALLRLGHRCTTTSHQPPPPAGQQAQICKPLGQIGAVRGSGAAADGAAEDSAVAWGNGCLATPAGGVVMDGGLGVVRTAGDSGLACPGPPGPRANPAACRRTKKNEGEERRR